MSEQDTENLDSLNETTEEVDNTEIIEELETQSEGSEGKPKYTELEQKLYKRAKKAEAENRELKAKLKPVESKPINTPEAPKSELTKEEVETLLLKTTKNYDDSLIDELKAIAKGKGISLLQAETSEAFQALLEKKADEKKKAEAKLGASKGSGKNVPKPMTNLSREEHMKLWEEQQGK